MKILNRKICITLFALGSLVTSGFFGQDRVLANPSHDIVQGERKLSFRPWEQTTITDLPWRDFQLLSREEKQERLFQAVLNSAYADPLPVAPLDTLQTIEHLQTPEFTAKTYSWHSDELPADREKTKFAHRWGTVGKANWVVNRNSVFTGLLGYSEKPVPLIVRFSQAKTRSK